MIPCHKAIVCQYSGAIDREIEKKFAPKDTGEFLITDECATVENVSLVVSPNKSLSSGPSISSGNVQPVGLGDGQVRARHLPSRTYLRFTKSA